MNAGHSLRRFGLLQGASSGPRVSLLIVAIGEFSATSASAFEDGLEFANRGRAKKEDEQRIQGERPCLDG